jgi:NAD(P)-dependent dehydrogenase (short-subunit alcohol dehydrogenase family)
MLKDRVMFMSGGSRGIGLAIARRLAAEGVRVVLWDRDPGALDRDAAGFEPLRLIEVDVADAGAVERAFEASAVAAEGIDILINNAGINGPVTPLADYPLEDWRRVMSVNLDGVFHGCRAAAPHMAARGWGRILNVASMAGKDGVPFISAYSAAKAGVIGFTKAIAKELAQTGVTVNALAPAMVETGLQAQMTPDHVARMKALIPMGRFPSLEEVADMAAFVVSEECGATTGFTFDLSGGRATY